MDLQLSAQVTMPCWSSLAVKCKEKYSRRDTYAAYHCGRDNSHKSKLTALPATLSMLTGRCSPACTVTRVYCFVAVQWK